jgi:hypothetical protein
MGTYVLAFLAMPLALWILFSGSLLPRRYRAKTVRSDVGCKLLSEFGVPYGNRTRVAAVKGRCPRPLDERDAW